MKFISKTTCKHIAAFRPSRKMSLVGNYNSSSDDDSPNVSVPTELKSKELINVKVGSINVSIPQPTDVLTLTITNQNTQIAPAVYPQRPYETSSVVNKNMLTGHTEKQTFDDATFNTNHKTFELLGYAPDPSANQSGQMIVRDVESFKRHRGLELGQLGNSKSDRRDLKSKRQKKGDPGVTEGEGAYVGPWAAYKDEEEESSSQDDESVADDEEEVSTPIPEPEVPKVTIKSPSESTEFHGKQMYDYLGRTYMHIPQDLDINLRKEPGEQECFVPKKKVYTFPGGHRGGVNELRFFPKSGHLLLSCGNDGTVKLWDCYHSREHLRTYSATGHKSVKDISFNNAGTQFLSTSYDKQIRLWDTETGQCISRFSSGATGNCVRFNPEEDKQESFVAGMSDKKIIQWDTRTKEIAQTYDHHLGAVNSITFVDENRRFMTTSDDKSIRVWEWQINVPIKFIADPLQHSMPTVALHPKGKYVAAQSMDNRILVFGATDRFRQNRKKQFTGHHSAGYPVGLDFSPDGKYLMSGDTGGYACFWDWKTGAMKSKFQAHEGVVMCLAAHPQETSKVVTGGLDSAIHYWD